jgi:hypothetical protein
MQLINIMGFILLFTFNSYALTTFTFCLSDARDAIEVKKDNTIVQYNSANVLVDLEEITSMYVTKYAAMIESEKRHVEVSSDSRRKLLNCSKVKKQSDHYLIELQYRYYITHKSILGFNWQIQANIFLKIKPPFEDYENKSLSSTTEKERNYFYFGLKGQGNSEHEAVADALAKSI